MFVLQTHNMSGTASGASASRDLDSLSPSVPFPGGFPSFSLASQVLSCLSQLIAESLLALLLSLSSGSDCQLGMQGVQESVQLDWRP